jgi:glycerol-3-phosphate dehydrogenase
MTMFPPPWRQRALADLDDPFDLVIIGGGITGCGILLDAAQRGLRVLLLERQDIASGTSSRSSKLIHGGLRYLRQLQFRVTRMACRERDRMLALNPLLVKPIRFLYPASRGDRVPGWTVDLGLWMYDRLTDRTDKHAHLGVDEVTELVPGLDVDDLDRAMIYTDAMTDDALLTLAVASTALTYGARVLTRAEVVEGIRNASGRVYALVGRDLESDKSFRVEAGLVVNATGVWVDKLRQRLALEGRKLRPSRGSHLVLSHRRLPLQVALTIPSPDDGRPVFLIPHLEGILVGTTDIYHEGSLEDPQITDEELTYLLRTLQAHFPERHLETGDVVATFAGLRPILDAHTDNPSEASREEEIWHEDGVLSVAGGKLTTWRPMAEEAVDEALNFLPEETAAKAGPCYTEGTPLSGLAPLDLNQQLVDAHGLEPAVASGMARRLRGVAWSAVQLARAESELRPITDGSDLSLAEVRAHLTYGAVLHLEDLLLRRVRVGLWDPTMARQLLPLLRPAFSQQLGWSGARWDREVERLTTAFDAWSVRSTSNRGSSS